MMFFTWGQMSRVRRWSRITVDFFIQHPVIARGAFIRFDQRHVLGAIHSRVCDMLLNARSFFLGEVVHIRKVNFQFVAPSPPSSGSLWRHPLQACGGFACSLWRIHDEIASIVFR